MNASRGPPMWDPAPGQPGLVIPLSAGANLSDPDAPPLAVRLSINGKDAWFVFDTGAGTHSLAGRAGRVRPGPGDGPAGDGVRKLTDAAPAPGSSTQGVITTWSVTRYQSAGMPFSVCWSG